MSNSAPRAVAHPAPAALLTAGRALLFATLLVPVLVVPGMAYPFVLPRAAWLRLVALALGVLLLLVAARRRWRLTRPTDLVAVALAAWVALGALTAVMGVSPTQSLFGDMARMGGVLTWFCYLVLYLSLRVFPTEAGWLGYLRAAVAVGAGVAAFELGRGVLGSRPGWVFGNVSYFAIFCYLAAVLAAYLLVADGRGAPRRVAYGVAAALGVAGVLATTQRGPLLALVVAVATAGGLMVIWGGRAPRWLRVAPIAVVLIAAIVVGVGGRRALELVPAVDRALEPTAGDASTSYRMRIWRTGWAEAREHPLVGIGLENFDVAFSRGIPPEVYRLHGDEGTYVDRAHNAFLDALVAAGWPGALAFAAIWAAALAMLRTGRRAGRIGAGEAAVLGGGVAGYAAYLVFWFDDPGSMVLVVTLLALVAQRAGGGPLLVIEQPRAVPGPRRLIVGLACLLLAVVAFQHAVVPALAAAAANPALEPGGRGTPERLAAFRRAAGYRATEGQEIVLAYAGYLESLRSEMAAARSDPARAAVVDLALRDAIARVDEHQAWDPENDAWWRARSGVLSAAAVFHADRRYLALALRDAARAIEMSPTRIGHRYHLSNLRLLGGDPRGAYEALEAARRLDPLHGGTPYRMSRLHLLDGELPEAVALLRESWELGYLPPEPALLLDVVRALGREGRAGEAGDLVAEYLARRYPDGAPASGLRPADLPALLLGEATYGLAGETAKADSLRARWRGDEAGATGAGSPRSSARPPR